MSSQIMHCSNSLSPRIPVVSEDIAPLQIYLYIENGLLLSKMLELTFGTPTLTLPQLGYSITPTCLNLIMIYRVLSYH